MYYKIIIHLRNTELKILGRPSTRIQSNRYLVTRTTDLTLDGKLLSYRLVFLTFV